MKIVVADDNKTDLDVIIKYLKMVEKIIDIGISVIPLTSGDDVLEYYDKFPDFDILILDIEMGQLDGITVARILKSKGARVKIIFVTAHEKYVFMGYRVNAVRYLVKPIKYIEFKNDLKEIITVVNESSKLCFYENRGSTVNRIFYDEIIFIETEKKHTVIHLTKDRDIISYKNMSVLEKALADLRFYRCHSSLLVNMDYISEVKGLDIALKNKQRVAISKYKRKIFMKAFAEYFNTLI